MKKILISWYALNNDFLYRTLGSKREDLNQINKEGPIYNLHQYFWDEKNYIKHIILNSNKDKGKVEDLVSRLKKDFPHRKIDILNVKLDDVINVSEVFQVVHHEIVKLRKFKIDVFISPGTPAMQTAWYLIKSHFFDTVNLFQIREAKFTESKKPEWIDVKALNSILPKNLLIAQETQNHQKEDNGYFISSSLKPIYEKAELISQTNDVGCLIFGENGTGKEHLATFIHKKSIRKNKPFLPINCAAFSDELLRSELFGHEKGSFTGANEKKIGVFESANGGSIFLDEIGDISEKMQVSLLRVIQEKKIQPIGSTKEVKIDVRIITATNKNLFEKVKDGRFRADLYFRLSATELEIPALRNRGTSEIKEMIEFFNEKMATEFSKNKLKISKEVKDFLLNYSYPGNVRELENLFLNFYVFCSDEVLMEHLPKRTLSDIQNSQNLNDVVMNHIIKVYNKNNKNKLQTSKILGISRDTLDRKLKKVEK